MFNELFGQEQSNIDQRKAMLEELEGELGDTLDMDHVDEVVAKMNELVVLVGEALKNGKAHPVEAIVLYLMKSIVNTYRISVESSPVIGMMAVASLKESAKEYNEFTDMILTLGDLLTGELSDDSV